MSIEIDILNGNAAWPRAKPLLETVWAPEMVAKQPWAHIEWAHADLRVLIDAPDDGGPACHVGIYFRTVIWNRHKVHIGGIGGVSTRDDCRRRGYASLAIDAAVQTMRANEAVKFALLFCEPHNFAFYSARGWHPFTGEITCAQSSGPIRFEAMAPFVYDIVRAPRQGTIDLCGLPW